MEMEDIEAASDPNDTKRQSRKRKFEFVDIKNESLDSPSSSSQSKYGKSKSHTDGTVE